MAVVDDNVQRRSSKTREATVRAAHAFVDYLWSSQAQQDFASAGFRLVARLVTLVVVGSICGWLGLISALLAMLAYASTRCLQVDSRQALSG